MLRLIAVLLLTSGLLTSDLLTSDLSAQTRSVPAADWPLYNRDLSSTRYSPLAQINTSNVANLVPAWTYKMRAEPDSPVAGTMNQVTPIVVNGVVYLPAGNKVVALNPDTGTEIWRYKLPTGVASQRGVAYWPGDKNNPARIFFLTGHKLVGLNAKTGKLDPGFGNEGEMIMDVPFAGVPTIYKNVIVVGMNVFGPGEPNPHPQDEVPVGLPGDSRAYDAITGKKLWEFHAVPHPGEKGSEQWPGDSWKRAGNNSWTYAMTIDEQRDIVYMPMGGPAANYYGGDRKGDNLFANSLVAVDLKTGKLLWYFQTVHHELWDFDLPPSAVLLDVVKDGKKIPAVIQTGKSGYMFILDRVTGKPVFGVEERKVPQGNVPGEWYSPTQPFPLKPPPLARVSMSRDDIVSPEDTTPEHSKACHDLWDKNGYYNDGPYTPWPFQDEGTPARIAMFFPGFTGGTNWGGAAADKKMNYVFVNSQDSPGIGWLRKDPLAGKDGHLAYDKNAGFQNFSAPAKDAAGNSIGNLSCVKPPWESLYAVNANTGDIAWRVPLGITEGLPAGKQNTGRSGAYAGPIATAGGLVFIGATNDNRFRAFDSKTGKELWTTKLEYAATAVPITFQGKTKQYVAIVAAGAGATRGDSRNQALMVYALP